ncbi:DUF1552 domain-containing protein [Paraliomyxa miuraensis]|uniref:DUF1552 domain-containing protein n=1 Tax=Paraliomyxa miuraensis TaxID=376150 RepID=UPI00224F6D3B|nr:DUF1552 domain-containing protein [Paraliomyxa miuraensis]MCX4241198.1 DUF1552 domain-containing protein [Paraliomyxa miuraensis]
MANLLRTSRRGFLSGAAAASAMSLPFLSSLLGRSAKAADGAHAKRLVVFFTPNEPIDRDHWKPAGNGSAFPLTSLPTMMSGLEAHRDDLVLVGDLEMKTRDVEAFGAGHVGIGHMLTGRTVSPYGSGNAEFWASGISVDQHVANHLGVNALTLAARPGGANGNSRISYTGANQPVHPLTRPDDAFDSLFADATLPADELAALRGRRLSVLDRVAGDLDGIKAQLPGEARSKLDVHLELVRDLELQLTEDKGVTCEPVAIPGGVDYESNAAFPTTARRQIDLLVQALACGLTDVASLQLSNSGAGDLTPLWAGEGLDINLDCHTIAHDYNQNPSGAATTRRVQLETFFFDMFAYLLDGLAAIPEGPDGGRLLDDTVVLWCKNLGYNHSGREMLYILAGGAGGALQTGRFVSLPGRPHNDLLVSVCNLMGMDDTSFGDPDLCTGALPL